MQSPPGSNEDKFQALNQLLSQQTQNPATNHNPLNEARNPYQPTPQELAYAVYILEHCFPASLQLYQQNGSSISITGQDAVAFLTTSGVHRLILRILWTVVDPQNIGTLMDMSQFHTIVRLVALTQAGYLEPQLLAVGSLPPPKPTPVQVVWQILNQNMVTVVPLAQFNSVVMPDSQRLQQIYMQQMQLQQQWAAKPNNRKLKNIKGKVGNAVGGFLKSAAVALNNAGEGLQAVQPEKTQFGLGSPVVSTGIDDDTIIGSYSNAGTRAGAASLTTGMAALDALGPSTDAPLPALGVLSSPPPDQFGGFAGATPTAATAVTAATTEEEFGGFSTAPPVGIPSVVNVSTQGMDALDSLSVATEPSMAWGAVSAPAPAPLAVTGMAALDAFGGATDAPLPALGGMGAPAAAPGIGGMALQNPAATNDFGGFTEAAPAAQPTADATGLGAFDALGPVANAPLPTLGGGGAFGQAPAPAPAPANDEDEFGGFTDAAQQPAAAPSGFGAASGAAGMSAFDAIGASENAPLPSLGTNSAATSNASMDDLNDDDFLGTNFQGPNTGAAENPHDMSFGSFAAAADPGGKPRSMNGSLRRRSSRSLISPETVPKDLMPSMPGEQYLGKVRQNSLRKLPELDLDGEDFDLEEEKYDDPFAGMAPAPGSLELNEASSLGPASESMPKDLTPHSPGERYVPHSKNASSTPGGLLTLAEPNNGVEDDEFGGFEEAPPKFPQVPSLDPASEPNPFSESMPRDMKPHAPGEHYVPHGAQASLTPGGLATVGEGFVTSANTISSLRMADLNPPTTSLSHEETPMPQDLKPHMPGEHYVPHGAAPTGLATVGEAFGELVQAEDAKLPGLGGGNLDEEEEDDFGGFTEATASAGTLPLPPPVQLSRQATPAVKDLEMLKRKMNTIDSATIHEDDEDEDDFGDFNNATASAGELPPPPVQLTRQATPAAKDLDALKQKASSAPQGATIQEGDEDEEDEDDFGDFASSAAFGSPGQMNIPPPTQMKRQETPRPQDLRPDPPTSDQHMHQHRNRPDPPGQLQEGGLGSLSETIEEDFGDFTQVGSASGAQAFAPPTTLSRQATPAAKDLELLPRKPKANNNETIFEETDEDAGFGDFPAGGSDVMPPPAQLSRQATPAAKDLEMLKQKGASGGALEGSAIQEGDEDEDDDDFGGFEAAAPPPQMSRTETPRPQDVKPKLPGSGGASSQPGLSAIGEQQEPIAEGAEDNSDDSTATPDPFAAFDTLAAPQAPLAPLPAHGGGEESGNDTPDQRISLPSSLARQTSDASRLGSRSTASLLDESDEDEESAQLRDVSRGRSKSPVPNKIGISIGVAISEDEELDAGGMDQSGVSDFDDFGDFSGAAEIPAPSQITRQATPAAKDLDPLTKKPSTGVAESVAIMEEDNEDEETDFGVFSGATAGGSLLPPTQLSRQATPAAKDLDPLTKKPSAGAMTGPSIQEGDEDEDDFGDFGGFSSAEAAALPAPTQLSRQVTPAAKDLDPMTIKASARAKAGATIQEGDEDEEDEFGDFGGFASAEASALPPPTQLSREVTPAAKDLDPMTKKASAGVVAGPSIQEGDEEEEEDGFGDFGGFASAEASALPPPTQLSRQVTPAAKDLDPIAIKASAGAKAGATIQEGDEDEEEDDFGDFGGFSSAEASALPPPTQLSRQVTPAAKDLDPMTKKASAGVVAGPSIQEGDEDEEDDFGDFGGFSSAEASALPPPTQLSRQVTPAAKDLDPMTKKSSAGAKAGATIQEGDEEEEDGFGDFGGFASAEASAMPPPTQLSRQVTPAAKDLDPMTKKASAGAIAGPSIQEGDEDEEDDFGDFGSFEQASEPNKTAGGDDDFGNFAAAAAPASAPDDDFGDFSSFSAAPAPAPIAADASWDAFQEATPSAQGANIDREKLVSLFKRLPPQSLRSFDYGNMLNGLTGTADSKKRADRSVHVLSLLTSSSSGKLASTHWAQVMDVAREELSLGNRLLEEALSLSSQEQTYTKKPFETMVSGMGEYVRATRSIVGSVGDMLLLDVSTPFSESTTKSSWAPVPWINKAWEVEKLWQELLKRATSLGISPSTRLETVVEIRTKCLSRCPSTNLCNLSLQPLSEEDRESTKATVDWGGKQFMACSANFLANKCPFYAVND